MDNCNLSNTFLNEIIHYLKKIGSLLDDVENEIKDFEDDSTDHNTFWGGAGPDCINGRLATA